jgi:redox-sensitive bicupin YhaK (pirin superfamily)
MKTTLIRSNERGHANHGWLDARHTFSFAQFYNPEQMHFGLLRVFNDDIVAPGMGFGTHPHDNMEIVTIPLQGDLQHRDSMGNTSIIRHGEVQIMSAGSGITHSEFNPNKDQLTNLLQIWVFPKERNIKPQYGQAQFLAEGRKNKLQTVVSPTKEDGSLWVNQDVWFSLANLVASFSLPYTIKNPGNGLWIFVIKGEVKVGDLKLNTRDSLGLSDLHSTTIEALQDSELVLIDVPML